MTDRTRHYLAPCAGDPQDVCWNFWCVRCDRHATLQRQHERGLVPMNGRERTAIAKLRLQLKWHELGHRAGLKGHSGALPYSDCEAAVDRTNKKSICNNAFFSGWVAGYRRYQDRYHR